MSKLYKSGKLSQKKLLIAVFLYGVEKIYSQWAFTKQSTIRVKRANDPLPIDVDLTAELIDKSRAKVQTKATDFTITKGGYAQFYRWRNTYKRVKRVKRGDAHINL